VVEANARAGLRAAVAEEDGAAGRVRRTEEIVARGRPHEEILKLARQRQANLIVVGRGRLSVLPTFGSCARRIAEAAGCPVLVVPGK
jgi:nucleotide-binding universal stress UspA family protein